MTRHQLERRVGALAQFRVADPAVPRLSEGDAHHLRRVLRARDGEEVVVTDGAGRWAIAAVSGDHLVALTEPQRDEPDPPVTLYLAPLKGDRGEWALAKATELGVSTVVPLLSERVVVRWRDGALERILARWRRIADEAVGQCRRSFDLVIAEPVTVSAVPAEVGVCDVGGDGDLTGVRALAVGPEGGWSPGEWGAERRRIGLGETVLRAETAAVAAATLLVSARPGWSRHPGGAPVGNDEETR